MIAILFGRIQHAVCKKESSALNWFKIARFKDEEQQVDYDRNS